MKTDELANKILKLISQKSSRIGTITSFTFSEFAIPEWPNSLEPEEILSLLDHLERHNWIKKGIRSDGADISITAAGQIHLEELSETTPDSSKPFVADYFDKPVSEALIERIETAKKRLSEGNYDSTITNCRTLMEELLKELLEKTNTQYNPDEGDIKKLYRQLIVPLNLNPKGENLESYLKVILQGLIQQIDGLYRFANKAGEHHVKLHKPSKHHAQLAVNVALTLCQFLVESYEHEKERNQTSIARD